jgi:hypothetical protein
MGLDPDELRRAGNHLRNLAFARPALFGSAYSNATVRTALEDATDEQVATIQELLPELDAMSGKMLAIDSRFKARVVGKVQLNPAEWGSRMTQYQWAQIQLGACIAVITPQLAYGVSTDRDRGW